MNTARSLAVCVSACLPVCVYRCQIRGGTQLSSPQQQKQQQQAVLGRTQPVGGVSMALFGHPGACDDPACTAEITRTVVMMHTENYCMIQVNIKTTGNEVHKS